MASIDVAMETIVVDPMVNEYPKTIEENPVKESKDKKEKTPKEKKPMASKVLKPSPVAIIALKEHNGSSPYAIAEFMSENYKSNLPPVFKKKLTAQL